MSEIMWGFSGPEFLSSTRRTRTLGLGASIRNFNDLAVPGLGGIWFGKQAMLATLGVLVAEQAKPQFQNVEVANAIEALACWLAFKGNGWSSDPRLRGRTKLQGKSDDFSFARVRQRNFYVTQPMRMSTVQALPALGLVETNSIRFNAFRISDRGKAFVELACPNSKLLHHWIRGERKPAAMRSLTAVLSPLEPLTRDACSLLREQLIQRGQESESVESTLRRRNALAWVEALRSSPAGQLDWGAKPQEITDPHWHDLQAGAKFFRTRDAALRLLDAVEEHIGNQANSKSLSLSAPIPDVLASHLSVLKTASREFLNAGHPDVEAQSFCRECVAEDTAQVLRSLVARDGSVLRLVGNEVKPGPAFQGTQFAHKVQQDAELNESHAVGNIPLPNDISYRMRNLYLLNVDLHGELSELLNPKDAGGRE